MQYVKVKESSGKTTNEVVPNHADKKKIMQDLEKAGLLTRENYDRILAKAEDELSNQPSHVESLIKLGQLNQKTFEFIWSNTRTETDAASFIQILEKLLSKNLIDDQILDRLIAHPSLDGLCISVNILDSAGLLVNNLSAILDYKNPTNTGEVIRNFQQELNTLHQCSAEVKQTIDQSSSDSMLDKLSFKNLIGDQPIDSTIIHPTADELRTFADTLDRKKLNQIADKLSSAFNSNDISLSSQPILADLEWPEEDDDPFRIETGLSLLNSLLKYFHKANLLNQTNLNLILAHQFPSLIIGIMEQLEDTNIPLGNYLVQMINNHDERALEVLKNKIASLKTRQELSIETLDRAFKGEQDPFDFYIDFNNENKNAMQTSVTPDKKDQKSWGRFFAPGGEALLITDLVNASGNKPQSAEGIPDEEKEGFVPS